MGISGSTDVFNNFLCSPVILPFAGKLFCPSFASIIFILILRMCHGTA